MRNAITGLGYGPASTASCRREQNRYRNTRTRKFLQYEKQTFGISRF